jgi:hypothetical protein
MIGTLLAELMTLSVIIFAAVAWIKQLGVRGKALTLAAFVFGLGLGIAYRFAMAPMLTFTDWFWAVCFGLLAGFMATGAYKGAESASGKAQLNYASATLEGFDFDDQLQEDRRAVRIDMDYLYRTHPEDDATPSPTPPTDAG